MDSGIQQPEQSNLPSRQAAYQEGEFFTESGAVTSRYRCRLNIFKWIYLLGVREDDDADKQAQKAISIYSATLIVIVGLLYAIYNLSGVSSDEYAFSNGLFVVILVAVLFVLIVIYCITAKHSAIRFAFSIGAILFPIVHSLTHGCQSVLQNGGSMFMFVIPTTASFLLTGGSWLINNIFLGLHLAVFIAVHVIEFMANTTKNDEKPPQYLMTCPTTPHGMPSVGPQLVGNLILILIGVITALLCIRIFKTSNDAKQEHLQRSLDLCTQLAHFISSMDLGSAKTLRSDTPGDLENSLFLIVENLEKFKPYLPDALFMVAGDDEEDAAEHDIPPTSSRTPRRMGSEVHRGSPTLRGIGRLESGHHSSPRNGDGEGREMSMESLSNSKDEDSPRHTKEMAHSPQHPKVVHNSPNLSTGLCRRPVTLLSVDARGFVDYIENTEIGLVEIESRLVSFLATVLDVTKANKGTLVSNDGGCLLLCWNGTVRQASHVTLAMDAALALQKALLQPNMASSVTTASTSKQPSSQIQSTPLSQSLGRKQSGLGGFGSFRRTNTSGIAAASAFSGEGSGADKLPGYTGPPFSVSMVIVSEPCLVGNTGTSTMKQFMCMGRSLVKLRRLGTLGKLLDVPIVTTDVVYTEYRMQYKMRGVDIVFFNGVCSTIYQIQQKSATDAEVDEWMYQLSAAKVADGAGSDQYGPAFEEYDQGRFNSALEMFTNHLEKHPEDIQARRLTRVCHIMASKNLNTSRRRGTVAPKTEEETRRKRGYARDINQCVHLADSEVEAMKGIESYMSDHKLHSASPLPSFLDAVKGFKLGEQRSPRRRPSSGSMESYSQASARSQSESLVFSARRPDSAGSGGSPYHSPPTSARGVKPGTPSIAVPPVQPTVAISVSESSHRGNPPIPGEVVRPAPIIVSARGVAPASNDNNHSLRDSSPLPIDPVAPTTRPSSAAARVTIKTSTDPPQPRSPPSKTTVVVVGEVVGSIQQQPVLVKTNPSPPLRPTTPQSPPSPAAAAGRAAPSHSPPTPPRAALPMETTLIMQQQAGKRTALFSRVGPVPFMRSPSSGGTGEWITDAAPMSFLYSNASNLASRLGILPSAGTMSETSSGLGLGSSEPRGAIKITEWHSQD